MVAIQLSDRSVNNARILDVSVSVCTSSPAIPANPGHAPTSEVSVNNKAPNFDTFKENCVCLFFTRLLKICHAFKAL